MIGQRTAITQITAQDQRGIYYRNIDGLRFIAFLLVFSSHIDIGFTGWFSALHKNGYIGVELFFVISSFLLTKLLVIEAERSSAGSVAVRNYFLRRVLRIWPLYFGFVAAMVMRRVWIGGGIDLTRIISLATFTENLWTAIVGYDSAFPDVAHLWTISLEEQYYLLLPFMIPILLKVSKRVLLLGGVAVVGVLMINRAVAVILGMPHPFTYVLPISGDAFVLGTMLGLGVFDHILSHVPNWAKYAITVVALGWTFFLPYVGTGGYADVIRYTLYAIGFTTLLAAVLSNRAKVARVILGNRPVRYLGKISYGLYVFHLLVISMVQAHISAHVGNWVGATSHLFAPICWIAALVLTIVVSAASYEVFERRFLRLKERFATVRSRPI